MQLPPPLQRAIDDELARFPQAELRAAAARLSLAYRQAPSGSPATAHGAPLAGDLHSAAYLAVRMPATYTALAAALRWTSQLWSHPNNSEESAAAITSLLDLGSGPGTAIWAASHFFPALSSATAVERDPALIDTARSLAAHAESPLLHHTAWLCADLRRGLPAGDWDLVVCSYALNELDPPLRAAFLRQAWERTARLLLLVEPGTPAGFANLLAARSELLASPGAVLLAPCPHSLACPMAAAGDWCHFAARVERSSAHRRLKDATLGHEDEKFSYLAFARLAPGLAAIQEPSTAPMQQLSPARILRHPRLFDGHAQLTLCRQGKLAAITVTRSQKEDWRRLKRLGWGDLW